MCAQKKLNYESSTVAAITWMGCFVEFCAGFFQQNTRSRKTKIRFGARPLAQETLRRARSPTGLAEQVRFGVRHGPSNPRSRRAARPKSRAAQNAHSRHLPSQKLRLGGDALGADPTYLLYLPYRSRGGLRRTDFGPWPRTAVSPRQVAPELARKPLAAHSRHFEGQKLRLGGDALGADPTYLLYLPSRSRGDI